MFHKLLFILLPISCLFMFQNSNQLNTVIQEVEEAEQTAKSVGVRLRSRKQECWNKKLYFLLDTGRN